MAPHLRRPPGWRPPLQAAGRLTAALALSLAAAGAAAQSVVLSGSLGADKALLLIDGTPQVLAVGASARGVTLLRLADGQAEVSVAGQRLALRLGGAPGRLAADGPVGPGASNRIVLTAGPGGHFVASGQINGKPLQFMVDTGATHIALSQSEANRLGLDWQRGARSLTQTANGPVPVHQITLSAVRVGEVELANVAAVVLPAELPMALLGNSFLNRFSMQREADVMRLDKKP